MEVGVAFKNAWIHKPGIYYAVICFKQNGNKSPAKVSSESVMKIQDQGLEWRVGPLYQPVKAVQSISFGDVQFGLKLSKESDKLEIGIDLFEEDSQPTSSTSGVRDTKEALSGSGTLVFTQDVLYFHQQDVTVKQPWSGRVFFHSNAKLGGLNLNIGWVSVVCNIKLPDVSVPNHVFNLEKSKPFIEKNEVIAPEPKYNSKNQSSCEELFEKDVEQDMIEAKESFPAIDAVKQILPLYHSLLRSPPNSRKSVKSYVRIEEPAKLLSTRSSNEVEIPENQASATQLDNDVEKAKFLDSHVISAMDYQTKELDRYRIAIRQMGDVIVELRREISSLEHDSFVIIKHLLENDKDLNGITFMRIKNSHLRAKIYYTDGATIGEFGSGDLCTNNGADISHGDILKRKLLSKTEEIRQLKEKIQELQNILIERNEYEKRYLQLRKAHELQQSILQELQAKVSKYRLLEKTCKDQEKIIEELERNGKVVLPSKNGQAKSGKEHSENSLVKKKKAMLVPEEGTSYDEYALGHSSITKLKPKKEVVDFDIEERFSLLQKLEKTEGRIMALETQISKNARHWAKQKSHLKLQMAGEFSDALYARDHYAPPLPPLHNLADGYDSYYVVPHGKLQGMKISPRYHYL